MSIADIYYVLFKHKWKIVICSLLGIGGAVAIYLTSPPLYVSEAKLLVKGVPETKPVGNAQVTSMSLSSAEIMNSEADILSSLDVVAAAVDAVGAEKVLGKNAGTTNREMAALIVRKQLVVDVPQRGNVLRVVMKHRTPEVAQQTLRQLIDAYFRKHVEIHRNLGFVDDVLSRQTDDAKSRLAATEESLRKVKSDAQITSLEDAKKQVAERLSKVGEQLRDAEVELEERRAALKELQKATLVDAVNESSAANSVSATNVVGAVTNTVATTANSGTNIVSENKAKKAPPELIAEYQRLLGRLEVFRKKEQELLANFRPESPLVREARENVEALEKEKRAMVEATPSLTEQETTTTAAGTVIEKRDPKAADIIVQNARITVLTAKVNILKTQFDRTREDVAKLDRLEGEITPLQRKKELEDANYRYYQTTLEQARFDNTLNGGQSSNIKEIQAPSLPYRDKGTVMKQVGMVAMGGIGLGLGLAFLLELMLDQSVRKPLELEQKFRLPTFLTIPDFGKSGGGPAAKALNGAAAKALPAPETSENALAVTNGHANGEVAPWDETHRLHPYSAALRDRLVSFFELKGLTHKPKLVALTSVSRGAGVTTLAAGLAASLSETGEGNVLLVDMNLEQGAAHPFYRGKPACGLADVLEHDKRPAAKVQDKLYMVHGGSADDRLPQILPKRISHLIPKLQASDYDYIIFDMPPITQTSVTPRLAAFMDMVFVVVEDEKTSREWLKQASALLVESKANLGAVFNKRRTYVPKWLHQEF